MLALNVSIPCESRGLGTRCEVARDQTWRSLFGSSQSNVRVRDNEAVTSTISSLLQNEANFSDLEGCIYSKTACGIIVVVAIGTRLARLSFSCYLLYL